VSALRDLKNTQIIVGPSGAPVRPPSASKDTGTTSKVR